MLVSVGSKSWNGKPSFTSTIMAALFRSLLYIVLLSASILPVVAITLVAGFGKVDAAILFIVGSAALVLVIMLLISVLQYVNAEYSIDEASIEAHVGVFKPTERVIQYQDITALQLQQGAIDGIAGTGTLVIRTDKHETSLRRIKNPQEVLTLIEKQTGERS